jgi:hypothetical protein
MVKKGAKAKQYAFTGVCLPQLANAHFTKCFKKPVT